MVDTYRQITYKLRIQRGPGRPDKVSERPRNKNKQYLDSDKQPTLITFDEHDQVDIPGLLKLGAIVPYEPPKLVKAVKGVSDGEIIYATEK